MRTTVAITPEFIKSAALHPGANRDEHFFDTAVNGFYLRVYANGAKKFGVKWFVRGKQRRMALGQASPSTLDKARAKAVQIINAAKQDHVDLPALERRKANRQTIGSLVPLYLDDLRHGRYMAKGKQPRRRTIEELSRYLLGGERTGAAWKPLHRRYPEDVRRDDVLSVLDAVADKRGPVASDRALSSLSAFYGWLLYRGHVENTPLLRIRKRGNNGGRDRVLSMAELRAVWEACEALEADAQTKGAQDGRSGQGANFTRIIRLLVLSGQRKSEIGGLHRDEINVEQRRIELSGHRTKNGKAHVIPLSDAAWDIVQPVLGRTTEASPYLFGRWGHAPFNGWSDSKDLLDATVGRKARPWTVHDLRRTFVTLMSENRLGDDDLVELIVNHVSGTRKAVAGVYRRSERLEERREALERWAALVGSLGAEQKRAA